MSGSYGNTSSITGKKEKLVGCEVLSYRKHEKECDSKNKN